MKTLVLEGLSRYKVQEDGMIYNVRTKKVMMTTSKNKYRRVTLVDDLGKKSNHYIHRLVGRAFISNVDNKIQIDHINRNRSDNDSSNLRWSSASEQRNNQDHTKIYRGRPISKHSEDGNVVYYKSIKSVPEYTYYRLHKALESDNTYDGYTWKYEDNAKDSKYGSTWKISVTGLELEASDLGYIRVSNRILNMSINDGYYRIKYKSVYYSVHSLAASAFIGIRPVGLVVDHIDGDKLNNVPTNLEYVTLQENSRRAIKLGKGNTDAVLLIHNNTSSRFNSIKVAAELHNISYSTMKRCCKSSEAISGNYYFIKDKDIRPVTRSNKKGTFSRTYDSIIEASAANHIPIYDIRVSCNTGEDINGYIYSY